METVARQRDYSQAQGTAIETVNGQPLHAGRKALKRTQCAASPIAGLELIGTKSAQTNIMQTNTKENFKMEKLPALAISHGACISLNKSLAFYQSQLSNAAQTLAAESQNGDALRIEIAQLDYQNRFEQVLLAEAREPGFSASAAALELEI